MTATVFAYETIGSTNEKARDLLADGNEPPFWVTAQRQSSGRGRNGRQWRSPEGNLYASFACVARVSPQVATQLSFVAGLAVSDTAGTLKPADRGEITLKWPNDVMYRGEKVAGVLLESWSIRPECLAIVIGIGINLCTVPGGLNQPARHLALPPSKATVDEAFAHLSFHLHTRIELWNNGLNFAAVRQAWLSRAHGLGKSVIVNLNNGSLQGTFYGLDASGSLLVETKPGFLTTITAGDVSLLNETNARAQS